jgi:error-prone DNA polymerase
MTLEDETGAANVVVWPRTMERFRRVVMGGRLVVVHGRLQRQGEIVHVVADRLDDRSDWLDGLATGGDPIPVPLAPADEVAHPGPPSRGPPSRGRRAERAASDPAAATSMPEPRRPPRRTTARPRPVHPRGERIVPRSRDFH